MLFSSLLFWKVYANSPRLAKAVYNGEETKFRRRRSLKIKSIGLLMVLGLLVTTAGVLAQGGSNYRGAISDDSPFIRIPVTVNEDGETIIADVTSTTGDLDTLLYLLDENENIVDENDDKSKDNTSSRIEFPLADAGTYTLVATRYKVAEGDSQGEFELNVSLERAAAAEPYRVADSDLAAVGFPDSEPRAEAQWTILVYYGGDNNLESGILNDLNEFELAGGSNSQTQIVALVDRSPGFTDSNGNWDTVRLFEVGADVTGDQPDILSSKNVATIDSEPLADLGELNTANGETLAQFLVWGMRHYPAQRYVVAFGSHGAAWQGLIQDDTSNRDLLSIPELQQAFALAVAENGGEKFDLLVNDACLMSSVEYFAGVAPYFHYALASPEIVVNPALDMTLLMQSIENAAAVDYPQVGEGLVDQYITVDVLRQASADSSYLTHSVTDLDQFDPVVLAVENFARVVNRRPAVYSTLLGEARANAYTYTGFLGENTSVDLGHFMRRVLALSTDDNLTYAAQAVVSALDQSRLYGQAGEIVGPQTSYYNIYFPDTSKDFKSSYFEQSPLQQWGKMLRNYYNAVTPQVWTGGGLELGFHLPIAPTIKITRIYPSGAISVHSQIEMLLEVVGRRIAYGDFTIDQIRPDGSAQRLSTQRLLVDLGTGEQLNLWRPGVDVATFFWDVTLPVVSDASGHQNLELLIFTGAVGFLDGRYREPGSDVWNDVGLVFNQSDDPNVPKVVQRIVNHAPNSDALAVIDIPSGSEFQAYSSIVTPDGRVISEPGNVYTWPEGGLTWDWSPAPTGQYNIGLLLTAFGGTTGFTSTTVAVNNDNIDLGSQGELWTDLAFSLLRPADWSLLGLASDDFLLRSQNADETQNITVYFVPGVGDNLDDIATGFAESYGRTLEGASEPMDVGRVAAQIVNFSYQADAGVFHGRGLVVFNRAVGANGIGMVFAAETLEEAGDLTAIFGLLRDSLVLLDPILLSETDVSSWTIDFFNRDIPEIRYPVLLDWLPGFEDGIWLRYTPRADADSPTFAAAARIETDLTDPAALVDQLVQEYAAVGADNFRTEGRRAYQGQSYQWTYRGIFFAGGNHSWQAELYRAERNGQPIIGRMYAMIYEGIGYAFWVETPDTDEANAVFADILEPMLDGFIVGQAQE
jgi:hypothetical protein